jgi:hypothetical protein
MAKEPYYKEQDGKIRRKGHDERRAAPRAPLDPEALYKVVDGQLVEVEITGKVLRHKPVKPLEIRTEVWYKSQDGRKLKLFHHNRNASDTTLVFIGIIQDSDNPDNFKPWCGDKDGKAKRPLGPDNDIVSEWSST